MQKDHQMTNPRSMVRIQQHVKDIHHPLNGHSNTLMLSADKGSSIERIAIYPLEGDSEMTQITTIPVPNWVPDTLSEPALPLGTTEFDPNGFMTNRHRAALMGCMMQLAEGQTHPTNCHTGRPNRPLQEIAILPVKGNTSYKAVRIARPGTEYKILRLSCGKSAHFLALKGMSILLLGPQCYLRDTAGNLLSGPWGESNPTTMEQGFLLLYDKELPITDSKLITDNAHHSILSLLLVIVLGLVLDRVRTCKRPQETIPEGSPSPAIHPEAYSPMLPRPLTN